MIENENLQNVKFSNNLPLQIGLEFPTKETRKHLQGDSFNHRKKKIGRGSELIWMMTTYPPRECGIATFSQDLWQAMKKTYTGAVNIQIAAIEKTTDEKIYPPEVGFIFHSSNPSSYQKFANEVNGNCQVKALIIQHEFGLFPDQYRQEFLQMLKSIRKPVTIAMHTVLRNPDQVFRQKVIDLVGEVSKVIVMTKLSEGILKNDYDIPKEKIEVIPHGTHLIGRSGKDILKKKYGLSGRTVLSTFGLISRNKSIETSLQALPGIVGKFPEVMFMVLGKTHPEVVKNEGEAYRHELMEFVKKNQLEKNVKFINHYLSLQELLEYLQATDIYLFTSRDPGQAVSGTFSYAMSAGCAMLSTPIPHAKELLENGGGLFFNFQDSNSLQAQLLKYLNEPALQEEYGRRALQSIAGTAWENVAIQYLTSVQSLCAGDLALEYKLPEINTAHLENLTTAIGIIQFSKYSKPDPETGYTLDDNSRALLLTAMLYEKNGDPKMLRLIETYLRFIEGCQIDNGSFINYKDAKGFITDENNTVNLEDSNGRAIWALGFCASLGNKLPLRCINRSSVIIQRSLSWIDSLQSPRAIALALKGLFYYQKTDPSEKLPGYFERMADKLASLYAHHHDEEWKWFEPYLTYANSTLPEAMLIASQLTCKQEYLTIAKESFDFLLSKTFDGKYLRVISNRGWLHKGKECASFGEQPIDVAYTVLALDRFYSVFGEDKYAEILKKAFNWFLGDNFMRCLIYNPATGGCFDGLEESGANVNQGAESTISYLLARLTVDDYYMNKFNSVTDYDPALNKSILS